MKTKKIFFLIFLFTCLLSLKAVYATDFYDDKIVEKIDINFVSNDPETRLDRNKVKKLMKTQEKDIFSQSTFDVDLKKLSDEFYDVEPNIKHVNNKLYINLKIVPNPIITKINFLNNKLIKNSSLLKELGIKAGEKFSKTSFNKGINKIKDYYIKKGFFESEISYKINPINKKDEVIIDINIKEGRIGKIKEIQFNGLTKKEEKEIKKILYSKTHNKLLSWITGQGIYQTELIDQDQMTIINYLNNKGYADARVDVILNEDKRSNLLIVLFNVKRGSLYHIGEVSFSGNVLYNDSEIKKLIALNKDALYSPDKIRKISQDIKDIYGQKGYIDTQVLQESHLHHNSAIYDLHFTIEEGAQYKIGLIRVFGNDTTKANVILRESLLTPGLEFDTRRLKATEARLKNVGYFKNVNVYAVKNEDNSFLNDSYRDVYIEVEEASTGSASLSLGMSSLDDIYGSFELLERNFNIHGFTKLFSEGPSALRGAGEYANAKATIGKKQQTVFFNWMDPYFRDSLWRFGFEVSYSLSELQSKDSKVQTVGGSLFTSYPITNYWTYGNKYRLRHSKTDIKNAKSKEDHQIEDNHGLISAVSNYLSYDSTDRPYKAHKGIRSMLEGEFSGLWGDFYFFKFSFINTIYIPIWDKITLKCRGDLKFLEPVWDSKKDDLPYSEKFFLGGVNSVRGYKSYILGPKRRSDKNDPLGGISSTLLSAELAYHVARPFDIFAFFDSGSVSGKHFKIGKLFHSYGFGIRLELMQGTPITLGYGFPINARKDERQKFFYSMGTQF